MFKVLWLPPNPAPGPADDIPDIILDKFDGVRLSAVARGIN